MKTVSWGAAATCMGVPLTANRNPQWSVKAAELEDRSSPGFNVFQMSFRSSGKGSQSAC